MDLQPQTAKPDFRWVTQLAGGCLLFLFLMLCATGAFAFRASQIASIPSPTPTLAATPTPHILVRQPADKKKNSVMYEDFSSNKREWGLYYPYGKLEIINGKLILQANTKDRFVIAKSREFDYLSEPYYIQADFSTDIDNGFFYGLIFGISNSLESYYLFEVSPKPGNFRLLKYHNENWEELVPFTQAVLKPFPEANTLSVYFDTGNIELYINGEFVSSFSDSKFLRSSAVGVFAMNDGYRLIVDDFFAYGEK